MKRWIALLWGIGGVLLLLVDALARLVPKSLEALSEPLGLPELLFTVPWLAFMGFVEGWRGFHLRFSPLVVARARYLAAHPRPLHLALAPVFTMGFFHATRRRLLKTWLLTAGIVVLVVLVSALPQPWRGLVDLGVVLGLGMGAASLLYHGVRRASVDPELPCP